MARALSLQVPSKKSSALIKKCKPYLFIAPALLPLLVFIFVPLGRSVYISFLSWNMVSSTPEWVGLANYKELLTSSEFWKATGNTLTYAGYLLLFLLVCPYLTAYSVTKVSPKLQGFYKSALFVPHVLSLAVSSVIFLWLLNPVVGVVNELLSLVQIQSINWLSSPEWALFSVSLIVAWNTFGYHFIILLAGIIAVPKEVVESARVEGMKSSVGLLRKIIIPLTGPTVLFVLIMTVVMGIQFAFVPVQMLTNGGPNQETTHLVFLTYQYGFQFFRSGLASATAVLTFAFFLVLIVVQALIMDRRVYYEN
jgi:sn-glycerol 3-phosphate transport system permease protein